MPMQTVDYYPPVPYSFHDFIDPYSMPVEVFNEFPFSYNFPNMEMTPMQSPYINWQQMATQLDNMPYFSRKVQYFDENGREQPSVEVAVEQQPYSLSDSRLFQQLMSSADCGCGEKTGRLTKKQIEHRQEESPVEDATDSIIKQQITQTPHGAYLQAPWTFAMQNVPNVANLRSAQLINPFNRKQSPKNWQMKGNWKKRRWNWWGKRREQWRQR
ncbi:hypothetical protein WR25_09761 [Diploscapter pachys]|uniref:Uncharacterized protein n=1 Tax=Diploscapter pachys TaxID=2018661 RepID=A0A2A2K3F9_9BILA|nr:hypothetical protein WR25_09761 [Diploscapter pachys]